MDLHRTNLVFDYGPGASATSPFAGLSKFGPFNAAKFGAPWKRRRNPVRGRTSPGKGRSNRKQAGQATGVTRWSEAPADKGP